MIRVARLSGSCKRGWMGVLAATVFALSAGVASAQEPPPPPTPPQQPQQQAPEPPDQLKFTNPAPIILINQIKAEKSADFEAAWTEIRAAFAKATAPEVKAFGDTLTKLYKVDIPPAQTQGGPAMIYIFQVDAPSSAFSYNPVKILYETLHKGGALTREEADAIYNKLKDSYASINPWPLVKVG